MSITAAPKNFYVHFYYTFREKKKEEKTNRVVQQKIYIRFVAIFIRTYINLRMYIQRGGYKHVPTHIISILQYKCYAQQQNKT